MDSSYLRVSKEAVWTISTGLADILIIVRTRSLGRISRRAIIGETVSGETGGRKGFSMVLIASPSREGKGK